MSDAATTAKTAREALARGLSALQSDPNVPPELLDLAAPIAQAMGALHAIERSKGTQLVPHAEVALNHTRTALSQLQNQPPTFVAVSQAMEAVAASLASVHALSRMAAPAPVAPAAVQPPEPAPIPLQNPRPPTPAPFQPAPTPQAAQPRSAPQQPVPAPASAQPQAGYARDPFAAAPAAPAAAAPGGSSLHPPSPPASGTSQVVNADLGTQSPTNFYKGLSGNDIIEHGGLFVSTYMIPPIGTSVRLKISLPGGYEFEANAVVRWSREQSDDNAAPPGFGAQFTQITPEARQLVYRYTRNREPLFHDDL